MKLDELSLLVNIVLSVLSFILATVSVVTVIIALIQNNKMLQVNSEQINEMRKEHELSLQPIIKFYDPVFVVERPRLFRSPGNQFDFESRFYFNVSLNNLSSAVPVNILCSGRCVLDDEQGSVFYYPCSEMINILADKPENISILFVEKDIGTVFDSLRELNVKKLPKIEFEAIFKNTTGGAFRIKACYIISPGEDKIDRIKNWHSLIVSSKVDYKDELLRLCQNESHDQLFTEINQKISEKAGQEKEIKISCVEIKSEFTYEPISLDEYNSIVKENPIPRFLGNRW